LSDNVRFEVDEAVAVIMIDRPEVRNAIDLPTARQIAEALDAVDERDDIRAAVLTGSGTIFSAGMDLKALNATNERPIHETRGAFGIVGRQTEKPLIAAVEGKAFGGGFEIALACDLIVAAVDAQFGLPEVKRGMVAVAGGVLRLPRRLPRNVAMELVLTGEPMSAAKGEAFGLVNRVVETGSAVAVATMLARSIAANAPLAVRTSKFLVNATLDWRSDEMFDRQGPYADTVRGSADAVEGARAFVEKRQPLWTNR
jgi:enoyl-CoA hydratase/crotonobetainyl-CoA hydratase